MRITIFGGQTKLGKFMADMFSVNHSVQVLGRPKFDLKEDKDIIPVWGAIDYFASDVFILNAFSHEDPMAQGRWFDDLIYRLPDEVTTVVIGSFAHHLPTTSNMVPGLLSYRAGKRFVHDVFIKHSTTLCGRILLLEPGTIRSDDWVLTGSTRTNYLVPKDITDAIELFLSAPQLHHCCWSIRGSYFPHAGLV